MYPYQPLDSLRGHCPEGWQVLLPLALILWVSARAGGASPAPEPCQWESQGGGGGGGLESVPWSLGQAPFLANAGRSVGNTGWRLSQSRESHGHSLVHADHCTAWQELHGWEQRALSD